MGFWAAFLTMVGVGAILGFLFVLILSSDSNFVDGGDDWEDDLTD